MPLADQYWQGVYNTFMQPILAINWNDYRQPLDSKIQNSNLFEQSPAKTARH
ncbi:Hsp33-like chaperonin [Oceanobacter sp. RED65]|uniref:Hsp33-like chaperonin n=1 Tax=Bermanella marisrubri TaxID=207949 RepID=Q1MYI5_9GAMM|nr:Hsp33-like chaperonin [Oceanobacter sp. RED65] [Bermanella marisrubri]